ncbi:MAG: hypothetical protein ASUL_09529 [Candidatus Aramenus sulfurataquae]|uniref:Uncharacterized protein n=1 Tax=Candidatus Aramenus sulfurataquae TaxID=1326980 RepID=W7L4C8_9CREN|nr:MAG: hypothetical protein ASUL_09529 [Candidatus Aramenus sulfurataquae]
MISSIELSEALGGVDVKAPTSYNDDVYLVLYKNADVSIVPKNAEYFWLLGFRYGTWFRMYYRGTSGYGGYVYHIETEQGEYKFAEKERFATPMLISLEELKHIIYNPEDFINSILKSLWRKITRDNGGANEHADE